MTGGSFTLEKCQDLLNQGLREEAQALAAKRDTRHSRNPALHLAWAEVLEELGLMAEVILELQLALRDDPDREETYRQLAEIYLDQGQPLKAARVWGGSSSAVLRSRRAIRSWGGPWRRPGSLPRPARCIRPAWSAPAPLSFRTT